MIPLELSSDDTLRALGPTTYETLIMIGISNLATVVLGLLLSMVLFVTQRGEVVANPVLSITLSIIANVIRSIPYAILILDLIPLIRWLTGPSVGPMTACVLLTIDAVPLFARLVESTLRDIRPGKVDTAHAMGSARIQTVTEVLLLEVGPSLITAITTTVVTLVGYSVMAELIGGDGLGRLAYNYGYWRFGTSVQLIMIVTLVGMVRLIQILGDVVIRRIGHR